ncbi:E3 ubiquitin-protein ligase TRIM39-like isoform X1 [Mauremys mutica]|uniref:E3 ubiquitin-protein ligase TRIM39-like isoform X1 n=1 Tax=Mauremys mutica TaxID=74926 RepID=UPI001D14F752|nr:E3 ubiquitin-protein ligase TRIM39-like isoform X1 [Mauremys mutica]
MFPNLQPQSPLLFFLKIVPLGQALALPAGGAQGVAKLDVTLDPSTANPYLVLAEDRKRVTHRDERQDLPDNPERFDTMAIVLGAEGFTGGRHYWEVEVGEKNLWTLGVCREDGRRKGHIVFLPKNGTWIIWQHAGQCEANASPPTLLSVSVRPRRVGIFLDYEAGEVSFYNVTDKSHLFTFTDTFSGVLCPYFNPDNLPSPSSGWRESLSRTVTPAAETVPSQH